MGSPKEISQRLKLLVSGNIDQFYGRYDSHALACIAVPNIVDADGINIRIGKTVLIGPVTGAVEYWWKNGVLDTDLIEKNPITSVYGIHAPGQNITTLRNAVKDLRIIGSSPAKFYAINRVRRNAAAVPGRLQVLISEADSLTGVNSRVILELDIPVDIKGVQVHQFNPLFAGYSGSIAMDWSKIPDGTNWIGMQSDNYPLSSFVFYAENKGSVIDVHNAHLEISTLKPTLESLVTNEDVKPSVISINETISVATNSNKTILPSVALSNSAFTITADGKATAKRDAYVKVVLNTEWSGSTFNTAIAVARVVINGVIHTYDLARPSGTTRLSNRLETPVFFIPKDSYLTFTLYQNSGVTCTSKTDIYITEVDKEGVYAASSTTPVAITTGAELPLVFQQDTIVNSFCSRVAENITISKTGNYKLSAFINWAFAGGNSNMYLQIRVNGVTKFLDKITNNTTGTDWVSSLTGVKRLIAGDVVAIYYNVHQAFTSVTIQKASVSIQEVTGNCMENASSQIVSAIDTETPITFNSVQFGENTLTGLEGKQLISLYTEITTATGGYTNVDLNILKNGVKVWTYRKSTNASKTANVSTILDLVVTDVITFTASFNFTGSVSYASASALFVPAIYTQLFGVNVTKRLRRLELEAEATASTKDVQALATRVDLLESDTGANARIATLETQVEELGTAAGTSLSSKLNGLTFFDTPFNYMDHTNRTKLGMVLDLGAAGSFDAGMVESPNIWYEKSLDKLVMIYTAYSSHSDIDAVSNIGWAVSTDGIAWEKRGIFYSAFGGIIGTRPEYGITGPVMQIDPVTGKYHLFYIRLSEAGYENGEKSLCKAVGNSIADFIGNTAIRQAEPVLAKSGTGWMSVEVYHPNFIYEGNKWYLFVNAGGVMPGYPVVKERTGVATATTLDGPWIVDNAISPILNDMPVNSQKILVGDPHVFKIGNRFIMSFFTQYETTRDEWAWTNEADFPAGWKRATVSVNIGGAGSFDSLYAHKPFILKFNNKIYHYYTAVSTSGRRVIGVSVSN